MHARGGPTLGFCNAHSDSVDCSRCRVSKKHLKLNSPVIQMHVFFTTPVWKG